MKQNNLLMKWLDGFSIIAVGFLLLLQLLRIYVGDIDSDDFEHLSSAWWIFNGFVPYRDFFQHHHPLFWYLIQPFFSWVHHPLEAFFFLRQLGCFCHIADLLSICLIVRLLGGTGRTALYALLIYLSYPQLYGIYIQGRPDIPMMTCLLWGVCFWIKFLKSQKRLFLILCYAFLCLSFAFLQKVALFLVPFGLYQLYLLFKKQLFWKDVGFALILPILIIAGYAFYLYQMGMLWRYVELNWILNLYYFRDYQTYHLFLGDWVYHTLFVLFLIYGIWKGTGIKRQLSIVLLGYSILFFMTPKPYCYYYLAFAPFMAIVVALGISNLKKNYCQAILILFCLGCAGHSFYTRLIFHETPIYPLMSFFSDLDRLDDNEWLDYQAPPSFPLYQKRPRQYYWYNWNRGAPWDIHLFHRHDFVYWNEWVYQTKPKIIIGSKIKSFMFSSDKEVPEDSIMQLDEDFLKENYDEVEKNYHVYRLKSFKKETTNEEN